MTNPKQLITDILKDWQEENSVSSEFEVSPAQNSSYGDLVTNLAMVSGMKDSNPRQVAESIVGYLKEREVINELFEKIEVAGPGFINFYLSDKYLSELLTNFVREDGLHNALATNNVQKVMVEFGDPNPFKEIHIGHLRNFCIGESFSRLLETAGNKVIRANYQGDVGLHVAKALWGILHKEKSKEQKEKISVEDLAEGYVLGAKMFENNENAKQEIIEINKKIYGDDESLYQLWEEGRKVSLEHFEEMYKRIGIRYDKYYYESVTSKRGKEIVKSHLEDGVFEESEGAVVYRGERDGLHTRVFLTSADYATYEGKDLALAILKNEEEEIDKSYILTGNEQLEYFQVMISALKKINPEVAEKTKHYTFGHVRLKEGKMSSRTGDVITASWLLDEAVKRVHQQFPEMDSATAEKVGVGAVKYSMLKFGITSDIHFDFSESITVEGNSGPYLQYSFVRTQSVLQKSSQLSVSSSQEVLSAQLKNENLTKTENWKLEIEEEELLRYLAQYQYHLEMASEEFAPNLLCNYLFELSQKFNLFYQKQKIIGSENEEFRLKLTEAVGNILKHGLHVLGIETVEKM